MRTNAPISLAYRDPDQSGEPWIVTAEGRDLIRRDRSNGVAQSVIAGRLGMSPRSFTDVLNRDDDVKAAYDQGSGELETELVGLLMQHARDGDRTSVIFALKALAGKREVGPSPDAPTQANQPNITIQIPPAMSSDQLAQMTANMRNVTPSSTDDKADAAKAITSIERN